MYMRRVQASMNHGASARPTTSQQRTKRISKATCIRQIGKPTVAGTERDDKIE